MDHRDKPGDDAGYLLRVGVVAKPGNRVMPLAESDSNFKQRA
jgi:hypothetical protein